MASNINCPNCKKLIPEGASVCPNCGAQLQAQTQQKRVSSGDVTQSLPDAAKQLDASATQCITIAGVLVAFYSGGIFAGKVMSEDLFHALLYALPLGLLLVTIIFALRVFYPGGYLSTDYTTVIKEKEQRFKLSSLFLEIAIGVLVIAVFVYLARPAI